MTLFVKKEPWVAETKCLGLSPNIFFDDIDSARGEEAVTALAHARSICADCTVRIECGEAAMREEADTFGRYGVRGYMTAEQRESIARRGGLRGRDPMLLVQGFDGKRTVPPVPDDGDRWSRHHTTLARKTARWLKENLAAGDDVPYITDLATALACTIQPLKRVIDALVQDGTLDEWRNTPVRVHHYVYRGGPHAISSYLPQHLRYQQQSARRQETL